MPGSGRRGPAQRRRGGVPAVGGRGAAACRSAGSRAGRREACRGRVCPGRAVARPGFPRPRPAFPAVRPAPWSAVRPALAAPHPPAAPPRPEPRRRAASILKLCARCPATPEAIPRRGLFSSHSAPPEPRHARCHPAAAVLPRAPRTRPRAVRPTPPYSPRTASRRPTHPGALMPPAVRPSPPRDVSLMSP